MLRHSYIDPPFYLYSVSGDDTCFVFLEKLSHFRCKVEVIVYTIFVTILTTEFCVT